MHFDWAIDDGTIFIGAETESDLEYEFGEFRLDTNELLTALKDDFAAYVARPDDEEAAEAIHEWSAFKDTLRRLLRDMDEVMTEKLPL